jgi:pimeloyl-ACP methyl ester carboxylesterase
MVHGKQDLVIVWASVQHMEPYFKHFVVWDSCGHMIPLERPKEYEDLIVNFIG